MKKRPLTPGWMALLLLAHLWIATAVGAEQSYLGLVTGAPRSSGHQMGMDLKALLKRHGIHLAVFNSQGSVDNIFAVYQRPGTHLGLVNSDVLALVAKYKGDPQLTRMTRKIKWIYPLSQQEVHILAGPTVRSLADLSGRQVALGQVESDSYLTGRLILEIADVQPARLVTMEVENAIEALVAGRIDALVVVDGLPVEQLALQVSLTDNLHLVPIPAPVVQGLYRPATIAAGTYPWQAEAVETVAVQTALVAYDFRNQHCRSIGHLARLLADHLDWLQINGHPKWRAVDLSGEVPGWQRYPCAQLADGEPPAEEIDLESERSPNPVAHVIEALLPP